MPRHVNHLPTLQRYFTITDAIHRLSEAKFPNITAYKVGDFLKRDMDQEVSVTTIYRIVKNLKDDGLVTDGEYGLRLTPLGLESLRVPPEVATPKPAPKTPVGPTSEQLAGFYLETIRHANSLGLMPEIKPTSVAHAHTLQYLEGTDQIIRCAYSKPLGLNPGYIAAKTPLATDVLLKFSKRPESETSRHPIPLFLAKLEKMK